jgi:hypothetical protein
MDVGIKHEEKLQFIFGKLGIHYPSEIFEKL